MPEIQGTQLPQPHKHQTLWEGSRRGGSGAWAQLHTLTMAQTCSWPWSGESGGKQPLLNPPNQAKRRGMRTGGREGGNPNETLPPSSARVSQNTNPESQELELHRQHLHCHKLQTRRWELIPPSLRHLGWSCSPRLLRTPRTDRFAS